MEENIYDYLGVLPKEGELKVKSELADQIKKWTNQMTRQAARAKAKLEVLKRFKSELEVNPNMLKEHADKYATLIKQKRQQQEKNIREEAAIYVVNRQIEEAALAELIKKSSAFTKEEILAILGAKLKQKKEFKYKETSGGRELDASLFKRMVEDLTKVNKRDLYDFLNVAATASASQIRTVCDALYADNQKRPANDEKTTINNLVGHCKTQLLDATKRIDYDFTVGNQVFASVRSKIERISAGTDRIIRPEQYKALLEECTRNGMPLDKAEYMIYTTAAQQKVTVVEPADAGAQLMCRFCGSLNSKDSKVCKSCGLPIVVLCPKCKRESSAHDELRCIKCGFTIGDFPKADALVKDAEVAIKYYNVEEAIRCIDAAINIWSEHPRLAAVAGSIKESQKQVNSALAEVMKLCKKQCYYRAQTYLGQIGFGTEATLLRKEIEGAVNNANSLIEKAKNTHTATERIDCYMQALSLCADCGQAKEKLQLTPPTAPNLVTATVQGKIVHLDWPKLPSQFIQYQVIRKIDGRPTSPTDGEVVCQTLNNSADDNTTEAGVSYYYAVYSKCGDVCSLRGAITTAPVLTVADLNPNAITLDIQENQIRFNFKFPTNAKAIEIHRDGALLKMLTGSSFIDSNLIPDKQYNYKFIAVFEDCTQKRYKAGGIVQSYRPMSPPKPVKLQLTERDDVATLSWQCPSKGTLCIYESDRPFNLFETNKVNIDTLKYKQLDTVGTSCQLAKNFSGVKYFLPITLQGNIGVVGTPVKLVSIIKPSGVRFDRNEGFVMVHWSWNNIASVRIKVQADGGTIQHYDIASPSLASYKVELPKQAKSVKITIASKIEVGNEVLFSQELSQLISLQAVKVTLQAVKSEAFLGIFGDKDKYSLSVSCDSTLPCALHLLIAENFPPTNLVNYKAHLVISPSELKAGVALKREFKYTRMQKNKPLYFRLITADRELAKQVAIIPETRQLK